MQGWREREWSARADSRPRATSSGDRPVGGARPLAPDWQSWRVTAPTSPIPQAEPPGTATSRRAWAHGLATTTEDGTVLDVWYPHPALGVRPDDDAPPTGLTAAETVDDLRGVHSAVVTVDIDLDSPPASTADAYLRLHLLSPGWSRPARSTSTASSASCRTWRGPRPGPCRRRRSSSEIRLRLRGGRHPVAVYGVDKFPRMTDYVVPSGVRIADADRVRLGAYLAAGTTVMHEGFVNFNAGTLGASMVEGRISQGSVVGDGSDIGGGRVDHGHAVGRWHRAGHASASGACSAPTPASASSSATTAWSRPAVTSPPARR